MAAGSIVPNEGLAELAGLAGNSGSPTAFTFLAVGSGDTTPAVGDSALASEITDSGLARAAATVTLATTNVTDDTLQLYKQWTVSATKTIKEVGFTNTVTKDAAEEIWAYREVIGTERDVSSGDTYTVTGKLVFARS
jgi:hypothetical protein